MSTEPFSVTLTHQGGYRFLAEFDEGDGPPLLVDERPPLGGGEGPSPTRLLATSMAHCLSASLLFCLGKQRIAVRGLRTRISGEVVRNEKGRLRVGSFRVTLEPDVAAAAWDRLARCIGLFEEFCTVTASVRQGLGVEVVVEPFDSEGEPASAGAGVSGAVPPSPGSP